MEDFWGIVVFVAFWVAIIAIIVNKKKKKKVKEKDKAEANLREELTSFLLAGVEGFENQDDYFLGLYDTFLESEKLTRDEVDAVLLKIPESKAHFSEICEKLAELGKNNICLMDSEKIKELESQSVITDDRITNDIIEVLPCLAVFYEEYNFLYKLIYWELLSMKIVLGVNNKAFGRIFSKEENYNTKEEYEQDLDSFINLVETIFDLDVTNRAVKIFFDLDKNTDVKNSTDPKIQSWVKLAYEIKESEDLFSKFLDIYVRKMQEIGRKYGEPQLDLYHYFNQEETKTKVSLPWFSTSFFDLPSSYLLLKEQTGEECLRVLELYTSGKMSGKYSSFNEKLALEKQ